MKAQAGRGGENMIGCLKCNFVQTLLRNTFYRIGRPAAIICWWLFLQNIAFAFGGLNTEYPDVFSHKDIQVDRDQVIGRLLVAKSSAVVDGVVTEDILVVEGNLRINSTAKIKGTVFVLGGYVEKQEGAQLKHRAWSLAPSSVPLADIVVAGFLVMGALSLVMLPFTVWLAARLLQKKPIYICVKEWFLILLQKYPILYVAAALGISGLMLLFFGKMAWAALFRKTMDVFDNAFIWLVRYFASPDVDRVMIFITNLGYGDIYGIIVLLTFLMLAYFQRWREVAGLALCLGGGAVLNVLLKYLFERTRPELFRVVEATGYSFPSGHAMVSLCFYGMVALLTVRNVQSPYGRSAIISCAVLLVAAIGVSRIYLGVHYPTDVIAGYAAGAMWLFFSVSLLAWWELRRGNNHGA